MHLFNRSAGLALVAAIAFAGCTKTETRTETVQVQGPTVSVTGDFLVLTGATLQLGATTANGTDASYTWSSANTAVATVSATGLVSGVSAGSVVITATGVTTGAVGTYNVVVAAQPPNIVAISSGWSASGHNNVGGEQFRHWDATPPIPTTCARCHSSTGFADYIGADGSAAGSVEVAPQPDYAGINCAACHSSAASALTSVTFPSGAIVSGLGAEARCITCHQGLSSGVGADAHIAANGGATDDTQSATLTLQAAHYFAAGATQFGGAAHGGYQYAGKVYDAKFAHVSSNDSCIECHDKHSLAIDTAKCATCHAGVTDLASLRNIREMSSKPDYDGDGDATEGIAAEIEGLKAKLLTEIQAYAQGTIGTAICYSNASYPYFFKDTNADGACDAGEAVYANRYAGILTSRLVRAGYNYQFAWKDPGAFAHNAKYVVQLLVDSIGDLNPAALANVARDDAGHFMGSGEPARHWDAEASGDVSASCAKCHSGSYGFRAFVATGVAPAVPANRSNGLNCETCHTAFMPTTAAPNLVAVTSVKFPSNVTVNADTTDGPDKLLARSFICMTCHSGREAKATVDAKIAAGTPGFRNIHYAAAGATLLGTEAKVGYEYDGKTYAGRKVHALGIDCGDCHDVKGHTFGPKAFTGCSGCHGEAATTAAIRKTTTDLDGDGNVTEPLADELSSLKAAVLAEMQVDATASGTSICYSATTYPYFLKDTDGNGTCDVGEATGYPAASWTPALAKAAFNYQMATKDAGAWAHNVKYVAQLLIDSVADLGGDVSTFNRP